MKTQRVMALLVGIIVAVGFTAGSSLGDQHRGAEKITLNGGSKGNVPFPHRRHQEGLKDCELCHSRFEKKSGVIDAMKTQGELKKKQVMNKLCIKCHKQRKRAGEKTGPTTCKKCHVKK